MNEAAFKRLVSGETKGPLAVLARLGLRVLSIGYGAASSARNSLFNAGLKKQHDVAASVVSVGNLTTGGTGKTPVVAWIVNQLVETGMQPAILSRGYRSIDGEANDEKLVLDQLCPGVVHHQDPDRVASATKAIESDNANVLVLDDGFQHRRIARDFNLVLIDATCPFGFGYQLPRGLLRESVRSLNRADAVLITRADQCDASTVDGIRTRVQRVNLSVPIFEVVFRPVGLLDSNGQTASFESVLNSRVAAFCAIGNPAGFETTLKSVGFKPEWLQTFPDHFHYGPAEFKQLSNRATETGVDILLTTQKDLVKLKCDSIGSAKLWAVQIAADFGDDDEAMKRLLKDVFD